MKIASGGDEKKKVGRCIARDTGGQSNKTKLRLVEVVG